MLTSFPTCRSGRTHQPVPLSDPSDRGAERLSRVPSSSCLIRMGHTHRPPSMSIRQQLLQVTPHLLTVLKDDKMAAFDASFIAVIESVADLEATGQGSISSKDLGLKNAVAESVEAIMKGFMSIEQWHERYLQSFQQSLQDVPSESWLPLAWNELPRETNCPPHLLSRD
jgi:hypothetical protein